MNDEQLIQMFEQAIPFNRLLGMRVDHIGAGDCRIRIPPRPDHVGNFILPALHGGVLSALADAAGGLAVFSQLSDDLSCATVDLRIDYLRPGRVDRDVIAHAEVVRLGNKVAVVNVDLKQVVDDSERTIAQVRAAYNIVAHRLQP
ncbi:MAG: hotdog fold thioesterase [Proteobacteria bacterium]|nr:hotdog fold thioesterase [Pseudomonadota bacterium]MCP4920517.1 hotdog fold thioesterase [Pseudomonadota bacterium]